MTVQPQVQREGTDVTLVGYGKMVGYNLDAAEELQKEGISCEVSQPLVWCVSRSSHFMLLISNHVIWRICSNVSI